MVFIVIVGSLLRIICQFAHLILCRGSLLHHLTARDTLVTKTTRIYDVTDHFGTVRAVPEMILMGGALFFFQTPPPPGHTWSPEPPDPQDSYVNHTPHPQDTPHYGSNMP